MSETLNAIPCPFCGENEWADTSESNWGLFLRRTAGPGGSPEGTWEFFSVECNKCGCHTGRIGNTPQEAIELWNKRAYKTEEAGCD